LIDGPEVSLDVDVVDGRRPEELEAVLLEQLVQSFRTSLEDLSDVIDLNQHHSNVHLVPGDRLEHLELGTFDVQAEQVDRRVAEGHEDRVEREALHFYRPPVVGRLVALRNIAEVFRLTVEAAGFPALNQEILSLSSVIKQQLSCY